MEIFDERKYPLGRQKKEFFYSSENRGNHKFFEVFVF